MTALRQLITTETKLFLRDPIAGAYELLFPTVLLLGLGSIPILRQPSPNFAGVRFVDHWAPSALVIGMIAIGVQHVPIVVATYRERGILRRLGTTPVHPSMLLVAQLIVAFVFVVLSAVILIVAAWLVLDVSLPQQPVTFMLAFVLGFAALVGVAMVSVAITPTAQSANKDGSHRSGGIRDSSEAISMGVGARETTTGTARPSRTPVGRSSAVGRVGAPCTH
ncbi:hypothetical protein BSZ39_12520 [Bowdeniella nasicola]|uniref:ABC-2 type transporter transmembrane domain-containing protein n=1 Tax=Bowdeniella nasicola TaxID=208480 RepID=A0A1Q5PYI1_9ACTO|nr:ABC transporter permease [Bowdeniella nasicola]OKL52546.1 hypothetical protein BSZ39_12520 [Bowdeniella nasicola]